MNEKVNGKIVESEEDNYKIRSQGREHQKEK
jgi:hypothetical protein